MGTLSMKGLILLQCLPKFSLQYRKHNTQNIPALKEIRSAFVPKIQNRVQLHCNIDILVLDPSRVLRCDNKHSFLGGGGGGGLQGVFLNYVYKKVLIQITVQASYTPVI